MTLPTIDYDALDPGIRGFVRLLREHGFNTCDSGDGSTKFPPAVLKVHTSHLTDADWARMQGTINQHIRSPAQAVVLDASDYEASWMACLEPEPHVYISFPPTTNDRFQGYELAAGAARYLWQVCLPAWVRPEVLAARILTSEDRHDNPSGALAVRVQMTYDPADDSAVVSIRGVLDADLKPEILAGL